MSYTWTTLIKLKRSTMTTLYVLRTCTTVSPFITNTFRNMDTFALRKYFKFFQNFEKKIENFAQSIIF